MSVTYKTVHGLVKNRCKTEADWAIADPILLLGEFCISVFTDNKTKIKIGDGAKHWSELPYQDDYMNTLITDIRSELDTVIAKNVLNLTEPYVTDSATIPGMSIVFGDSTIAETMTEHWLPIILDDSDFASEVGLENDNPKTLEVFENQFSAFAALYTGGNYAVVRDSIVNAFRNMKSGDIISSGDTDSSEELLFIKTTIPITVNSDIYDIPVIRYYSIPDNAKLSATIAQITAIIEQLRNEINSSLSELREINAFNIIGYNVPDDVVKVDWQFTSSDMVTMRNIKPFVTGFPIIDDINSETTFDTISSKAKELLARYIDPELATTSDSTWFNTVLGEYNNYVNTNLSTLGDKSVFYATPGDTYVILPTDNDTDYGFCTYVGYEIEDGTVYQYVYHTSDKGSIDQINTQIQNITNDINEFKETVEDVYATKDEMSTAIRDLGNLMRIVDVVDDPEDMPGYGVSGLGIGEDNSITEDEKVAIEALNDAKIGDVYVVGDETVDNKSEYAWICKNNKYWYEYIGKISEVDMSHYYNKDAIDEMLNELRTDVSDLGIVLNYKGTKSSLENLPTFGEYNFIEGYRIDGGENYDNDLSTLALDMMTNDLDIGDTWFVGTNTSNMVAYVFVNSLYGDTSTADGYVVYRWVPLGKLYDADIANLNTRVRAIEDLTILNINSVVGSLSNMPSVNINGVNKLLTTGIIANSTDMETALRGNKSTIVSSPDLDDLNSFYKISDITLEKYQDSIEGIANVMNSYDEGDIIYLSSDLNSNDLSVVDPDKSIPYMLYKYRVGELEKVTADSDSDGSAQFDVYKLVKLAPSAGYISSLDARVSALETTTAAHSELLTDYGSRIAVLENAGYATVTYVDQKVEELGKLLRIKGSFSSTSELPGYTQNPNVLTGITAEELSTIIENNPEMETLFKVGDTYLIDNGDSTNKYEYSWVPFNKTEANPDYIDDVSTPDTPQTIIKTYYRWEQLGSLSGLDLESYYTKIMADDIFLRKDDPSVLKTTDNIIIDADENASTNNHGGTSIKDAVVPFVKADTFEPLDTIDTLGINLGRIAKYYDEINDLKSTVILLQNTDFSSKTTIFNEDGTIRVTYSNGEYDITEFNEDGSITTTRYTSDDVSIMSKTTRFNGDGSITEISSDSVLLSNTQRIANLENSSPLILSGTLDAGQTTLTIANDNILESSIIDVYTNVFGVAPNDISVTTGSVVLTFESQDTALEVRVRIVG